MDYWGLENANALVLVIFYISFRCISTSFVEA
jgi:hypothetical protein